MCMTINPKRPMKGPRPPRFDKAGLATCWKVYYFDSCAAPSPDDLQTRHSHNDIGAPDRHIPQMHRRRFRILPGWVKSNRKHTSVLPGEVGINHGIHVYTSERAALDSCSIYELAGKPHQFTPHVRRCSRVVPVRCHRRDLVAVGSERPQAVFMKVFLYKADYDQART